MSPDIAVITTTLAVYAAVVISPGPNFVLVSRLAASGQCPAALGATVGLAIASLYYAILTMAGLAVLLQRIGWLSQAAQIAGGCYLIYLGVSAWIGAAQQGATRSAPQYRSAWHGLRLGFFVNLSNPKAIAFFVGLYMMAMSPQTALWAKVAILIGGFSIELLWYGLVSILLSRERVRSVYERFTAFIDRAVGSILAAFGIRMVLEKL